MKFYDASRAPHLETDALGVSLEVRLLQVKDGMNCGHDKVPDNASLCPIAFASKGLWHTEQHHSNIECEVLGIIHGLEKVHHYCFAREYVSSLTKAVSCNN